MLPKEKVNSRKAFASMSDVNVFRETQEVSHEKVTFGDVALGFPDRLRGPDNGHDGYLSFMWRRVCL